MKIIVILLFLVAVCLNAQSENKTARAGRIVRPITLDGIISPDEWKGIPVQGDFLQQEPVSGSIPRLKTEARIAYDDDYLYISVMCYDSAPDSIIAREMKWDGKMSGDDNVMFILDTFNDDRNAYWFGTNPLGMRDDAQLNGFEFSGFNETWNGVWDIQSAITDSGWSTEIRFPFSTLKFAATEKQVWGINFSREVRRTGEVYNWTSIGKDKGLFKIAYAGDLIGLDGIKRGDPVYVKPFVTSGYENNTTEKTISKAGLDVKYGVTNSLSLDVTVNTDFAQVEADRAQINLTRFPLYYPEKREFFLEGANIFNYQVGGGNYIFYSRRIGLSNREEVPLYGGLKLVGREGKWDVGVLSVQTKEKANNPSTNFSAARVKYDLFEQSYVGLIFTGIQNKDGYNRVAGADFEYSSNTFMKDKNIKIGGGLVSQFETGRAEVKNAAKLYADYPNDLVDAFLGYRYIPEDFRPGLGLFPRTGIHSTGFNADVTPRVEWNGIKKLLFTPLGIELKHSINGDLVSADYWVTPFGFLTKQGDKLTVYIGRLFDKVENDFTFFNGKSIKAGNYWSTTGELVFTAASGRPVYGNVSLFTGDFYNGYTNRITAQSVFSLTRHITVTADYQINAINLDNDKFNTVETGGSVKYDFSTSLNTSVLGQWNNESKEMLLNYRLVWQPKTGSAIYFVVNQLLGTGDKIQSKAVTILAKAVWLFTFSGN